MMYSRLVNFECEHYNDGFSIEVDLADVVWLAREVWQCRSCWDMFRGSQERSCNSVVAVDKHGKILRNKGLFRSAGNMELVRWDYTLPARPDNLVMMNSDEAKEHVAKNSDRLEHLRCAHPLFVKYIESILHTLGRNEFGIYGDECGIGFPLSSMDASE